MMDKNKERVFSYVESHREEITPQFIETMTSLLAQSQSSEDKEMLDRMQAAYRSALRFSMQANMKK